jgi:hypothetical protein
VALGSQVNFRFLFGVWLRLRLGINLSTATPLASEHLSSVSYPCQLELWLPSIRIRDIVT